MRAAIGRFAAKRERGSVPALGALLLVAALPLLARAQSAGAQGAQSPAPPVELALTFDDLPNHGGLPPGMSRAGVARSLIAALQARRAPPSYGFVNAQGLSEGEDQREVLRLWRAAGYPLGNHAFSHMDLNTHSVAEFEEDVRKNEPILRELMAAADWRFFRFPYLHQGDSEEKRRAVADFLRERGYRVAEVTLNFDDWAYNDPYARCSAKQDASAIEWLKQSYRTRASESLERGRREARALFGREIRHVMLLHNGAFTAAMMPSLLDLLEKDRFEIVELAFAEADPVYASVPARATPDGQTLLDRARHAQASTVSSVGPMPPPPLEKLAALCR
jgi:peptidoglycan/xylan/chitin deacetylase (PgdA/CDA1 family)